MEQSTRLVTTIQRILTQRVIQRDKSWEMRKAGLKTEIEAVANAAQADLRTHMAEVRSEDRKVALAMRDESKRSSELLNSQLHDAMIKAGEEYAKEFEHFRMFERRIYTASIGALVTAIGTILLLGYEIARNKDMLEDIWEGKKGDEAKKNFNAARY